MKSFFALFFPFLFPDPVPGDIYVHRSEYKNPFIEQRLEYEVLEVKDGWVKLRLSKYYVTSRKINDIKAFFYKIN